MWHKVDSMWRPKKRNIFVSLSFWSMTEVVKNIWQGPLYHFFIKVVNFWSLLEIEFPEATYASTWMYYILHTASKRKHYHLPALRARNSLWERASAEKYIKYRTKKSFHVMCSVASAFSSFFAHHLALIWWRHTFYSIKSFCFHYVM